MKNLKIFTLAIVILAIAACTNAQFRETVHGNGNVVTKERTSEPFHGIKVSSGIDVYLKQGNNETISVEADENLQEYILTEVRNGVLNVYTDANIRNAEKKRAYVTINEVNSISTTSAGDVIGQTPIKTDKLRLSASSAGNINLEVAAKDIDLDISS